MTYDDTRQYWESLDAKAHLDISPSAIRSYVDRIEQVINFDKDSIVLDVACGDGLIDELIKKEVGSLSGFDFSKTRIDQAKERNPECDYWVQSFLDSYKHKGYDIIFSYGSMQYCKPSNAELFINNSIDALSDNGILAHIDVPDLSKIDKYFFRTKNIKNYAMGLARLIKFNFHKDSLLWDDGTYVHDIKKLEKDYSSLGYKIMVFDSRAEYRSHILIRKKK